MTDPDLLDLLEILGDMNEAIAGLRGESRPDRAGTRISTKLAERKIDSFRSAIRQRMIHNQEQV